MAHRDGATGAADTVDPQGPTRDDAGEDAVTAPDAQGAPDDAQAPDATAPAGDPAAGTPGAAAGPTTGGEAAPGPARKPRLPRPATGRTPAFGLSLAAIRQRAAGGSEGTDALRRNLADKEAQTAELREALDALRQALDDTTPPKGPDAVPAAAGRRRRPLLVLLAVLAVVAVVVAVVATRGSGDRTATGPSPSTSPSASASQAPSVTTSSTPSASAPAVSPSTSAPAPAVTTTPMPWRGETLLAPPAAATAGPGVDTPGTDLTVAIDADLEHVDVFERAVLATPQSAVTLALPPATAWGDALSGAEPVVSDLQVVLDGVAVRPQRTDAGWYALPANGGTVTKVELRYRVAGTFVKFAGSKKDRRSIGVPSFTGQGSLDAAATMHVTVDDPRVANVYCLTAASGTGVCANGGSDGLTANVQAGSSPVVLLQADVVPLG